MRATDGSSELMGVSQDGGSFQFLAQGFRASKEGGGSMGELKEILMFCTLYAGVMMGALAYTLNVEPQRIRRD